MAREAGVSSRGVDGRFGLLERDEALARLARALDRARDGAGCTLFVQGEAGLGKSTLLDAVRELAGARGSIVEARGSATEADLPFAYVEQLGGTLAPNAQAAGALPDPLGRRALAHDLARRQLASWTRRGELLVLLDDMHWADPDSLGVL